jgi:hypothetical protein
MKDVQRVTANSIKNFKVIPENKIVVGGMYTGGIWMEFVDTCTADEINCLPEFIINDSVVSKVNAIAKCDPKDTWNEKVGIDVASAKLDMKEHKRRVRKCERLLKVLNSLTKKTEEICYKHRAKATAIEDDLRKYYGGDI